jgi:hypothetical protein
MHKEEIKEEKKGTLSRREFLRNAGIMVGGATVGSMAILSACKGETVTETATKTVTTTTAGAGTTVTVTSPAITVTAQAEEGEVAEAIIKLNINGHDETVMVRPNWTLQHVIHSEIGMTGTKEWCDAGACGACSVIMDGRPVLSCMMLAIECVAR